MFWKFDLHTSSHVDTLLERENVTLFELLEEEDVLQECKVMNRKLVEFLVQPQHMEELVTCITEEPSNDVDEKLRYKYPSVSCEILTADVAQINDALGEDESLLKRLYDFLQNNESLNPLLASFFSKVMGILINRKTEQIVAFLRKKDDFVSLLLQHIGTSAIMDLLLRLLTCVEQPQLRQDVFNWLNEEKIVQRLIEMIHPSKDDNQHSNASQSLCDIIRLSREQMIQIQDSPEPDQLLATLEKQETIEQLLTNMFEEHNESVIVHGIQVLLTLLEPRRPRSELGGYSGFYCNMDGQLEINPPGVDTTSNTQASLGTLLAIKEHLRDFHQLLVDPPKKYSLQTTWGVLDPPLGNTRLHVVKLLASAINANNRALNQEVIDLDTLNVMLGYHPQFPSKYKMTRIEQYCIEWSANKGEECRTHIYWCLIDQTPVNDLYFKYMYNNFLHSQVELCITTILNSTPIEEDNENDPQENPLVKYLLQKCRLFHRILSAWEENEKEQSEGGRRKGFMGHLTKIANALVQSSEKGPNVTLIALLIKDLSEEEQEQWDNFITGSLTETNKKNTVDLVNTRNMHSSSDDDESDLKEFNFPQEAVLQQAFVDYQMQQMTSAFIDHFGFNDEEFGEQEESVNAHFRQLKSAPFDKTANITFSLNADEESPNSSLFEICYKERIQQFDDDEDEGSDGEDIWQEKEMRFSSGTMQSTGTRSCGSTDSEDSRDSDEEEEDSGGGDVANPNNPVPATSEESSWTATCESAPTGPASAPVLSPADSGSSFWDKTAPLSSSDDGWAVFTDLSSQMSSQESTHTGTPVDSEKITSQEENKASVEEITSKTSTNQERSGPPQSSDVEASDVKSGDESAECRLTWNGETDQPEAQNEPGTQTNDRVEDIAQDTSTTDIKGESKLQSLGLELPNDTIVNSIATQPLDNCESSSLHSTTEKEVQRPDRHTPECASTEIIN